MFLPVRRYGAVVVGVLVALGPLSTAAHAQFRRPVVAPFNPFLNRNPFVNPFVAQQAFNAAVLGQALQNPALFNAAVLGRNLQTQAFLNNTVLAHPFAAATGYGYGLNYGLNYGANYGALAATYGGLGYGALNPAYANAGLGYGSLLNGGYGGSGGYNPYLYGYGTQWMMNPYEGYLRGAADVTNANAQYQTTIQQARLVREEAHRSILQTRRAAIEEAEYERAHMPDPEKIRQAELARELDRARVSPPLTEVWSAKSHNALLRNLIAQQGQGARGPNVPLSDDTLKSINLSPGDTRGNIGLLKNSRPLQWPPPLQGEAFKEAREDLNRRLKDAVQTIRTGNSAPDDSTLKDLEADLKKLHETLDASVSTLSPDQYIEAKRYLKQVGDAYTALKNPNVSNFFENWKAQGKNVAELVQFMAQKGLWFAAATPGDEPAYLALYYALASFDAGLPRTASTSGSGGAYNR